MLDIDKWEITGTQKYLEYNGIIVEGTFGIHSFVSIFDSGTGTLLSYKEYFSTGELANSLEVKELNINNKISDKDFVITEINEYGLYE